MIDRERAYAKINLALHVRRRRNDGYHELETVFAFCTDGDDVSVESAGGLSLTIDGPFAKGLSCTDNLVVRAARSLDDNRGATLRLTKNLPVAAGIGGGSADAAATLRLLSRTWVIDADLHAIAAALGSDVPACLSSIAARGEGRGELLDLLDPGELSGIPVLLVNPNIPLATAGVFAAWDGVDRGALSDWRSGRNDLEAPARLLVPEIGALLDWLAKLPGATLARMSGSGATCFALFDSMTSRDTARHATAERFPTYWSLASSLR